MTWIIQLIQLSCLI